MCARGGGSKITMKRGTEDGDGGLQRRLDEADTQDIAARLAEKERKAKLHTMWAVLGVSPAALIPLIATASEFGVWAAAVGMSVIVVKEAVAAMGAGRDASALRRELHGRLEVSAEDDEE